MQRITSPTVTLGLAFSLMISASLAQAQNDGFGYPSPAGQYSTYGNYGSPSPALQPIYPGMPIVDPATGMSCCGICTNQNGIIAPQIVAPQYQLTPFVGYPSSEPLQNGIAVGIQTLPYSVSYSNPYPSNPPSPIEYVPPANVVAITEAASGVITGEVVAAEDSTSTVEPDLTDTTASPSDIRLDNRQNGEPTPAEPNDAETVSKKNLIELNQQLDDAVQRARDAEQRAYASEKSAQASQASADRQVKELEQKIAGLEKRLELARTSAEENRARLNAMSEKLEDAAQIEKQAIAKVKQAAADAAKQRKIAAELQRKAEQAMQAARNETDKSTSQSTDDPAKSASELNKVRAEMEEKLAESEEKIRTRIGKQREKLVDSGAEESSPRVKELDQKLAVQLEKSADRIRASYAEKIVNLTAENQGQGDK